MSRDAAERSGMEASFEQGDPRLQLQVLMLSARKKRQSILSANIPRLSSAMTESQRTTLRMQTVIFGLINRQLAELQKAEASGQPGRVSPLQNTPSRNASAKGTQAPAHEALAGDRAQPCRSGMLNPLQGQDRPSCSKRRWQPSKNHLHVLETYYKRLKESCGFVYSKEEITVITEELSLHGDITEAQVRNWFHNQKKKERKEQRKKERKEQSPSEELQPAAATSVQTATIVFHGHRVEVEPETFNVRGNFGDNVVLLDPQENVLRMNDQGVTLSPLEPGGRYTLHFKFDV